MFTNKCEYVSNAFCRSIKERDAIFRKTILVKLSSSAEEMFKVTRLTGEIVKKVNCPGCDDHVEVSLSDGTGRSCVMIQKYMDNFAERVKKMEIYSDDVW